MIAPQPNHTPLHRSARPAAEVAEPAESLGTSLPPDAAPTSELGPSPVGGMVLSTSDAALLSALFQPGATAASVAAAHRLSPVDLALWLAQAHIQPAYQAMLALEAHFARQWAERHHRAAVETLTEIQQSSDNPTERRRAATSALAALRNGARRAPSPAPRGGGGPEGHGARRASEESPSPPRTHRSRTPERAPQAPTRAPTPADLDASIPHVPTESQDPKSEPSPKSPTHPTPHTSHPTPHTSSDSAADAIMHRLLAAEAAGEPSNLHSMLDALGGPSLESAPGAIAFKARFDHLVDQLPGATVTSDPAEPEPGGLHARKCYTLSYPDDAPLRFVFRLYHESTWWLEDIIPLDSQPPDSYLHPPDSS